MVYADKGTTKKVYFRISTKLVRNVIKWCTLNTKHSVIINMITITSLLVSNIIRILTDGMSLRCKLWDYETLVKWVLGDRIQCQIFRGSRIQYFARHRSGNGLCRWMGHSRLNLCLILPKKTCHEKYYQMIYRSEIIYHHHKYNISWLSRNVIFVVTNDILRGKTMSPKFGFTIQCRKSALSCIHLW